MLGIWMAMVYTARPYRRGSGALETRMAAWPAEGLNGTGEPCAARAAAARLSGDVGDALATNTGRSAFPPPSTVNPGTSSAAASAPPWPPAGLSLGPAEKAAEREPGAVGTAASLTGSSPTMASAACALPELAAGVCCGSAVRTAGAGCGGAGRGGATDEEK